jgi:hypothetical protein
MGINVEKTKDAIRAYAKRSLPNAEYIDMTEAKSLAGHLIYHLGRNAGLSLTAWNDAVLDAEAQILNWRDELGNVVPDLTDDCTAATLAARLVENIPALAHQQQETI